MVAKFKSINEELPQPFKRVWVRTDQGASSNGYIRTNGSWVINCQRLVNAGHKVVEWKA